jgi:hypothetical protein
MAKQEHSTSPSPRKMLPVSKATSMKQEAVTSDQCRPNGIW